MNVDNLLPDRIREWLHARGITNQVIENNRLFYDYQTHRIGIPVRDENNMLAYHKYRRDPESSSGPKYTYDRGGKAMLFGSRLLWKEGPVIICEGEFDAMLLESKGFIAVTSTGGAFTFREEWADILRERAEVYICLDNDLAGQQGSIKISRMIPNAKMLPLPGVGPKGDITDYFLLGNRPEDFKALMEFAEPLPLEPEPKKGKPKKKGSDLERAKSVPLSNFIKLSATGSRNVKCPFHEDGTASFHWYREQNRWNCFGGCGNGDVVDFVMKKEALTMQDAIQYILR